MATFPALRSGTVGMYPSVLGLAYATEIVQFVNDSEQRWATRVGTGDFELTFTDINGYDLGILLEFFHSTKGQFDSTWSLTINGNTYNNCCFLQDDFAYTDSKQNRYSTSLKCRQVRL
jgi:hypothetical protein